jgi:hypothetical protein
MIRDSEFALHLRTPALALLAPKSPVAVRIQTGFEQPLSGIRVAAPAAFRIEWHQFAG